ncbi:unnamed protein product [Polarella glacialis]|uniref:Uncharacterized protein n=1 Tax=Polarella glacialis TaxID=89957 RepID=A0A813F2Z0_POLGL|nr:unnamed protein product [Polarella glacialis]
MGKRRIDSVEAGPPELAEEDSGTEQQQATTARERTTATTTDSGAEQRQGEEEGEEEEEEEGEEDEEESSDALEGEEESFEVSDVDLFLEDEQDPSKEGSGSPALGALLKEYAQERGLKSGTLELLHDALLADPGLCCAPKDGDLRQSLYVYLGYTLSKKEEVGPKRAARLQVLPDVLLWLRDKKMLSCPGALRVAQCGCTQHVKICEFRRRLRAKEEARNLSSMRSSMAACAQAPEGSDIDEIVQSFHDPLYSMQGAVTLMRMDWGLLSLLEPEMMISASFGKRSATQGEREFVSLTGDIYPSFYNNPKYECFRSLCILPQELNQFTANMMLTKGIQMVGLALAFPLCIGTALVLGTLLTRLLQGGDSGNDTLLFLGVGIAFIAVCATSLVHKLKDAAAAGQHVSASASKEPGVCAASSSEDDSGEASGEASVEDVHVSVSSASTGWKLGVCIVGGLLMSLWNPLTSMAQKGFGDSSITDADGPGLSPYGSFFFFSVGIVLSSLLLLPLGILFPLDRAPSVPISLVAKDYTSARCSTHLYGLIGGLIWAVGTLSNAVSGQMLSLAASYAIGQSAPMVSIFWGVFLFREFAGAPCLVKGLLVVVVLLYMVSIALIASSRN